MRYAHAENVNMTAEETLKDTFVLNSSITPDQRLRVQHWADILEPPSAPNAAAVKANCQHWALKVIERLRDEGIVTQATLNEARRYKQTLPNEDSWSQ
jgi:hypothetical protein